MAVAKTLSKSKKLKPTGAKASKPAKASARAAVQPKGKIQNQAAPAKGKAGKGVQPATKSAAAAKNGTSGKITSTLKNLLLGSGVSSSASAKGKNASAKAAPAAKGKAAPAPAPVAKAKAAPAPAPAPAKTVKSAPASNKSAAVAQSQKPAKAHAGVSSTTAVLANPKAAVKRAVGRAGASATAHGAALEGVCREVACENLATTGGYCRLHYIKNWKKIKRKEAILAEGRLNQYIEELVSKYPDKYIEAIRQDLATIKDFLKVISDLDLDEGTDEFEGEGGEQVEGIIDNIRREFDDEGETF